MQGQLAVYVSLMCSHRMPDQLNRDQKVLCRGGFFESATRLCCPACRARELYVSQTFVSAKQVINARGGLLIASTGEGRNILRNMLAFSKVWVVSFVSHTPVSTI
jgi:hypothetical protein